MPEEDIKLTDEDLKRFKSRSHSESKKEGQNEQMEQIKKVLSQIKHKIVVCSGKGGVGKSTVAVNIALSLAEEGLSVGILDVDITGPTIPKMLDLEGQRPDVEPGENRFYPVNGPLNVKVMSMAFLIENSDTPVIWRGPLKMGAIRQFIADGIWGQLDYLVLDLPPGTSDETLDIMQYVDGNIVVVTTPQEVATLESRKAVNMALTMKRPISGIIENMSGFTVKCKQCGKEETYNLFGQNGGEKMAKDFKVPFLGKIPLEISVMEQGEQGLPIVVKYPESASAKAFKTIVKKIRKSIEGTTSNA